VLAVQLAHVTLCDRHKVIAVVSRRLEHRQKWERIRETPRIARVAPPASTVLRGTPAARRRPWRPRPTLAGLTARARPEARPDRRAANLGKLIRKLAEAGKAYYSVTWINVD
jgi:hypothetical protein